MIFAGFSAAQGHLQRFFLEQEVADRNSPTPMRSIACLLACLILGCASTQESPPSQVQSLVETPTVSYPSAIAADPRPYLISPGDTLRIVIYARSNLIDAVLDLPAAVVSPDGTIALPRVGQVRAQGKTSPELRAEIERKLESEMISPVVNVVVTTATGEKVYVIGEVIRPGVYQADNTSTVLDVLLAAGGFTQGAHRSQVLLFRTTPLDPAQGGQIDLDIKQLLAHADIRQNANVQRGDIVYIPMRKWAQTDRAFTHIAAVLQPFLSVAQITATIEILRGTAEPN